MMDRIPSLSIPGLSLAHPLSIPTTQNMQNHTSHTLSSLSLHHQNLHGGGTLHNAQQTNLHQNVNSIMNSATNNR